MKYIIIFIVIVLIMLLFPRENFNENIKPSNSLEVLPLGITFNKKNNSVIEKIKSIPLKQFKFQSDQLVPVLKDEEVTFITNYLQRHFPNFLKIERLKKEQQENVKRYDVVFLIKDKNPYNHIVLTKIIIENGKIFFNTLEYGGMVLPDEVQSIKPQQQNDDLFFINESSNKITFLDSHIKDELDKFEKNKIEILLRRGRKAS